MTVNHVVMTSDERNATWWREVAEMGWFTPDHTNTKALYGDWSVTLSHFDLVTEEVFF
jgi:hypothetical protein